MKKSGFILAMLVLLLVFGLAFVSCDMGNTTKFEGRWYGDGSGELRYTFTGNNFTLTSSGGNANGTFDFDNFNLRFTASNGATYRVTYTLAGNNLNISAGSITGSISPARWTYGDFTRR